MTIASEFRRRIANGDFRPGDPLPSENDLVVDFGYSKPTVREALRILENEGLIEVKRGLRGGPQVRRLSISEVAKPMGTFLQIGDVAIADVLASRDRIVAASIERLASRPNVDLEPLEKQVEVLEGHIGDLPSFYLDLISAAEVAVELAGSATDHVVVVALRHVIELELAAATAAVGESDLDIALDAERDYARSWRKVLRNIRAGRARAARNAYVAQASVIQEHFDSASVRMTVGDAESATREELIRAHAASYVEAPIATLRSTARPRPRTESAS